jgi:hypothetical protein
MVKDEEIKMRKKCERECVSMEKLQLTGQNLGRVFNFISGHLQAAAFLV